MVGLPVYFYRFFSIAICSFIFNFKFLAMSTKLNNEQETEFLYKLEWCHFIIEYVTSIEKIMMAEMLLDVLEEVRLRHNLRSIRYVYNDTNEMALSLSDNQSKELNKRLFNKFGTNLNMLRSITKDEAKTIISHGKISDKKQYKQLLGFVDAFYLDSSCIDDIQAANSMLAVYENMNK